MQISPLAESGLLAAVTDARKSKGSASSLHYCRTIIIILACYGVLLHPGRSVGSTSWTRKPVPFACLHDDKPWILLCMRVRSCIAQRNVLQ